MRYVQNARVAYQVYDGVAFLVQPDDHTMHRLDEVGSMIWEALEEPRTAEALAGRICAAYAVERPVALEDARRFLAELQARGLVASDPSE